MTSAWAQGTGLTLGNTGANCLGWRRVHPAGGAQEPSPGTNAERRGICLPLSPVGGENCTLGGLSQRWPPPEALGWVWQRRDPGKSRRWHSGEVAKAVRSHRWWCRALSAAGFEEVQVAVRGTETGVRSAGQGTGLQGSDLAERQGYFRTPDGVPWEAARCAGTEPVLGEEGGEGDCGHCCPGP